MIKIKLTLLMIALSLSITVFATANAQQAWMSPEVGTAWSQGYLGQGVRINMIDDFGATCERAFGRCHGAWTTWQAQSVAPRAAVVTHESVTGVVGLVASTLNVFNLSYGFYNSLTAFPTELALLGYAQSGRAVIVKSAGNSSIPVGAAVPSGEFRGKVDNLAV
ncbi:MAG: hypothetical protein ACOYMH_11010, partial [Zwartia sp.]